MARYSSKPVIEWTEVLSITDRRGDMVYLGRDEDYIPPNENRKDRRRREKLQRMKGKSNGNAQT